MARLTRLAAAPASMQERPRSSSCSRGATAPAIWWGVASLALVSPAPASSAERVGYEQTLADRNSTSAIKAERAALQAGDLRKTDLAEYQRRIFALAVTGYFHDPSRARELTPFRITGRTQQEVWNSLGDDYDIRPALRELDLRAIVLHGDDDPIPVATARATAEALKAELVVLPDSGHVPYIEAAEQFRSTLDAFLPSL